MAETTKLSVEKALNKLRDADAAPKSRDERRDDEMQTLKEEIARSKAQRRRLERQQRKTD